MRKPSHIAITIPNPCTQDWDAMTSTTSGRHCDSCQKMVIDFTAWSDAALYNFIANNKGHVCGRYLVSQVDRPIHIPYQPHSRLYRMVVAMGLTLMFTQVPAQAKSRPPIVSSGVMQSQGDTLQGNTSSGYGQLRGSVTNNNGDSVYALVIVSVNGITKAALATDLKGRYIVDSLAAGYYDVKVSSLGYVDKSISGVVVTKTDTTTMNFTMSESAMVLGRTYGSPINSSKERRKARHRKSE